MASSAAPPIRVPQQHTAFFVVERASLRDAAGILSCLQLAFEPYRQAYTPAAFRETVLTPETVRKRLEDTCVFIARSTVDGIIVGTVGYQYVNPAEGHLRGLAVLPYWQKCGVASKLLKAVESEMRTKGHSRITLDTAKPLTHAICFYERNGFLLSGKITTFFGMDLIEYVKLLSG